MSLFIPFFDLNKKLSKKLIDWINRLGYEYSFVYVHTENTIWFVQSKVYVVIKYCSDK